ncbi:hypothetical protein [Streptomyces sp. NPDC059402]|uniref:hypothetical protein n=1 Tax=Streptomyces sp. NPDC059402 TaxID=3346822 RepID=UPI0036CEDD91
MSALQVGTDTLHHVPDPHTSPWGLVVLHTDHPLHELSWLCAADAPPVLDTRRRSPLTKTAAPPEAGVPAAAEVTA